MVEMLKVAKKLIIKCIRKDIITDQYIVKKEQPGLALNDLVWVLTNTVVVLPWGSMRNWVK